MFCQTPFFFSGHLSLTQPVLSSIKLDIASRKFPYLQVRDQGFTIVQYRTSPWEDAGTFVFQVDVKGACVARRGGVFGLTTNKKNAKKDTMLIHSL
jgi:hypothetical protein